MTKKMAVALALVMLALVCWGLFVEGGATRIIVNGQEVTGPFKGAVGAAGLIVAAVASFCAAIFLAFVMAGAGLFILGCVIFFGLLLAWLMFPYLLLVLLPLAVVWLFVALVRPKR